MSVAFLLGVPGKLKTLLDRLTTTRAGYLDAAISSRATATALSTAQTSINACATATNLAAVKTVVDAGATAANLAAVKTVVDLGATAANLALAKTAIDARATSAELATAKSDLNIAITQRASAATALSNTIWTDARALKLDNLVGKTLQYQIFTTSGTWVRPAGVTEVWVELIGGGGAGGPGYDTPCKISGGGGGSGGVIRTWCPVSGNCTIDIGVGGASRTSAYYQYDGNSGGNTMFNNGIFSLVADGGTGGNAGYNAGKGGTGGLGGVNGAEGSVRNDGAWGGDSPGGAANSAYGYGGKGVNSQYVSTRAGGSGRVVVMWFQ